jgi:anti-sigma regulatory factor (Ser/Thr protein kinase)
VTQDSRTAAQGTFIEVRLGASLVGVRVVNDIVDAAMRALGIDDGTRHDVTLGVAELVANVVEHEYRGGPGDVAIRLDARPGGLALTIDSAGPAFDLGAAIARARSRDPLRESSDGGLGLAMLVAMFDDVRHERRPEGNRITLVKGR